MDKRTIRDVAILLPDPNADDLTTVAEPPDDDLVEALVVDGTWAGWQVEDDVRRSRFTGVELTNATVQATTISGCTFERVDLSGSRWRDVTLDRTVFKGCRFLGAHLTGVTFKDVIFEDCRLDYATLERLRTTGPTAFIGCSFAEATVARTTMPQGILDGCQLTRTELIDCDLRDTDLRGSDLTAVIGLPSMAGARVTPEQLAELIDPLVHYLRLQVSPLDTHRAP